MVFVLRWAAARTVYQFSERYRGIIAPHAPVRGERSMGGPALGCAAGKSNRARCFQSVALSTAPFFACKMCFQLQALAPHAPVRGERSMGGPALRCAAGKSNRARCFQRVALSTAPFFPHKGFCDERCASSCRRVAAFGFTARPNSIHLHFASSPSVPSLAAVLVRRAPCGIQYTHTCGLSPGAP